MRNSALLQSYISEVERRGFRVAHTPDFGQVVVYDLPLPTDKGVWTDLNGRHIQRIAVSFSIPLDFPYSVPGVGFAHPENAIHIPRLFLNGRTLSNHYDCQHSPWCWLCFQRLDWNPDEGTLATLINTVSFSLLERAGYLK